MNYLAATGLLLAINNAESVGTLIGGIFIGVVCGIGPFVLAVTKRSPYLGVIALFCCLLAGFFGGIVFAAPMGILWATGLYFKRNRSRRY